tara:strand:+ start:1241 stop:1480 length:240 start_codon:yes stop_codon:yes gene_type:complete
MSLRDDNKVDYNYQEYLNELDWVSHNTAQRPPTQQSQEDKLISLTKAVEGLHQEVERLKIELYRLEGVQEKQWETYLDS